MASRIKPEKIRQAISYIAAQLPERGNMYKVLKTMYFADKCHLKGYGREIFGDNYLAMKHGPVPWTAYRWVTNLRDGRSEKSESLYKVEADHTIVALLQPELEVFSESDLQCMNEEIAICRPLSFAELKKRSHDSAYDSVEQDDEMSIESIAAATAETEEERKLLLEHLANA